MAPAPRDENWKTVIQGVSELDEKTTISIAVNPDSDGAGAHGVIVEVA